VDLRSPRPIWRIPADLVARVSQAVGNAWQVTEVAELSASDGDGGSGSRASLDAARGAEVYFGWGIPPGVIEAGRDTLRWMHTAAAGVGQSLHALRDRGIVLTNSAGVHAEPMADWVIAAVAYFARGLDRMAEAQRAGRWIKDEFGNEEFRVHELIGFRLGLFGLGGVGTAVARRALALGMSVAGIRRRPERGGPAGLRWVGGFDALERLAAESDALVLAVPRTTETERVIGPRVLRHLPPGALVVNVSRGAILDEAALLEGLAAGRIGGAALDVFATEPLPPEHPFWAHPRVLVSPHVSGVTTRFWEREGALMLENIRRYLAGEPLRNVVDLETGY
jgi:phosphoglycerate dehydrogenase-like enzyme